MNFWTKFSLILQLAPTIIGLVKQVEAAIPGSGKGSHKLDLVLNTVKAAAEAEPGIHQAISLGDLQTATTAIVKGTVAVMNASGAFTGK